MTEPRVFIVHEALTYDPDSGRVVSRRDLSQAQEFGRPVSVVPPGMPMDDRDSAIVIMEEVLADIGPDDYLLLTGAPEYIAAAGAIAAANLGGRFRYLRWVKFDRVTRTEPHYEVGEMVIPTLLDRPA